MRNYLIVRIGNAFTAQASGWGVLAVPLLVLMLLAAALAGSILH